MVTRAAFSQFAEHMSDSDMNVMVMKGVTYLPKKR